MPVLGPKKWVNKRYRLIGLKIYTSWLSFFLDEIKYTHYVVTTCLGLETQWMFLQLLWCQLLWRKLLSYLQARWGKSASKQLLLASCKLLENTAWINLTNKLYFLFELNTAIEDISMGKHQLCRTENHVHWENSFPHCFSVFHHLLIRCFPLFSS